MLLLLPPVLAAPWRVSSAKRSLHPAHGAGKRVGKRLGGLHRSHHDHQTGYNLSAVSHGQRCEETVAGRSHLSETLCSDAAHEPHYVSVTSSLPGSLCHAAGTGTPEAHSRGREAFVSGELLRWSGAGCSPSIPICAGPERSGVRHPGCQAVVFDASAAWCHLGNVIANSDCSNMELATSGMTHYQTASFVDPPAEQPQVCGTNQVLQGATCECAPGYRGNPCTAYIGDCEDLRTTGVTADGVYSIFPLQAWESFPVYCSFKSKARTWIMERYSTNFSFNLTWAAYRDGFGSLAGDYWLGLQKIHLLTTSKAYSLRVGVKLKNSTTLYQTYNNFAVADESNYFRLSVGPFSSTDDLGNCLQPLNGSSFSTHDSDHDGEDAINCAAQRSGGWWFRSITCSTCNPTGLLGQAGLGGDNEAFWTNDKGRLTPLKISFYLQTM